VSAHLISRAIRRAEGAHPSIPRERLAADAEALWHHMMTGSAHCMAPYRMIALFSKLRSPLLVAPGADRIAEGVVALARTQAARGVRTILPRPTQNVG